MEWKDVTPEEAAANKYYGLGGWLLFFYVIAVLGFVLSFFSLMNIEGVKQSVGSGWEILLGLTIVQALLLLPFIILAPQKNPLMPKATISAYWFSVALSAIAAIIVGPAQLLPQVLVGVAIVLLFSWYLNKSKRVNVTYRHRVPAETDGDSAERPAS